MKISAIAAIGENRELGKDNQLLWRIPEDSKYFKETTTGHVVIMGRKTYESMMRLLPNRTNIIVTRDIHYDIKGAVMASSLENAIQKAKKIEKEEIFVIGGGQIYQKSLLFVDRLYLTLVHASFPDATAFFPEYSDFSKVVSSRESKNEDYSYTFIVLERK